MNKLHIEKCKTTLEKDIYAFGYMKYGIIIRDTILKHAEHNENGVILDVFADATFKWDWKHKIVAYDRPWIGFIHDVPTNADWYPKVCHIDTMLINRQFLKSLSYCRGIFVFANYLQRYLRPRLDKLCKERQIDNIPIYSLIHPSTPVQLDKRFNFNKFMKNENKTIYHVGSHLRNFYSFYKLEIDDKNWKKAIILKEKWTKKLHDSCLIAENQNHEILYEIPFVKRLNDEDYDNIFIKNVIFCHLYNSAANNLVVECILHNTPILINKLPAVVEYLGEEYPFYFHNVEEASQKLKSFKLIEKTCDYLHNMDKYRFSLPAFQESFLSEITSHDL